MKVTIPTSDQVFGKNSLQIFKIFGTKASATDLASLQHCWSSLNQKTPEQKLSVSYYIQLDDPRNLMRAPTISQEGTPSFENLSNPSVGVRPVIPAEEARNLTPLSVRDLKIPGKGSLRLASFGEYPQTIADPETEKRLEKLFFAGLKLKSYGYITCGSKSTLTCTFDESSYVAHGSPLKRTHRKFTMENQIPHSYNPAPLPRVYPEYQLDNKRYIHFFPILTGDRVVFANGQEVEYPNTHYWIEVKPIEWIMDPSGAWISKDILFSNIKMDDQPFRKRTGRFETSSLKTFLQQTFSPEITAPVRITRQNKKAAQNRNRQNEG